MFTMMNHARLNVGLEGVGIAERAYQHARAYALDRVQGRTLLPASRTGKCCPGHTAGAKMPLFTVDREF
jgi:alkylation response protein AidB-like acyl-CoA dehydrogenase